MADVPDISIIVPVFGSDGTLVPLYERVLAAVGQIPASFELIFVDDRGPGNPWEIINKIAQSDPRVKALKLSKNFGQLIAITAGVDVARGRWLVIIDCDLQDRPEEIPRLWAKAMEGHDIVVGRRVERQDGLFKRMFSRTFHFILRYITDQQSDAAQSNFGIYSRRVVDSVQAPSEQRRIFPLLIRGGGYEIISIDIEHNKRPEGKSGYTFSRKLSLAMNIILFYSNKPLKLCIQFGFLTVLAALCYGAWLFICHFLFDSASLGCTKLTISLFFLSGIILLGAGILGIYIVRIFNRAKGKPLYSVIEKIPK
jgi:polyisoprenyl-phosphate glycosyltransferase